MEPLETYFFISTAHPGDTPRALVFARALVRPLALCMLPVMIGALVAVLEGQNPLAFLLFGAPLALGLAAFWAQYQLRAIPAELYVRGERAGVRSVWESATPPLEPHWWHVLDLRKSKSTFTVTLGLTAYELPDEDWPEHAALLDALRDARDRYMRRPLPATP